MSDDHPVVASTEGILLKTNAGDDGLIRPLSAKCLSVCVSKESIRRGMHIMDMLLKAVEAAGWKIGLTEPPDCRTVVTIDGERLAFSIRETTTMKRHVPTSEERRKMAKMKFFHGVPNWDRTPTGNFVMTIDQLIANDQVIQQARWTDGARKRIEDWMVGISETLANLVKAIKARQASAKEERKHWYEEQERLLAEARHQADQKGRAEELLRLAAEWEKARSVRSFVDAVKQEALRLGRSIDEGSPLAVWLQMGEALSTKIDPIPQFLSISLSTDPSGESTR